MITAFMETTGGVTHLQRILREEPYPNGDIRSIGEYRTIIAYALKIYPHVNADLVQFVGDILRTHFPNETIRVADQPQPGGVVTRKEWISDCSRIHGTPTHLVTIDLQEIPVSLGLGPYPAILRIGFGFETSNSLIDVNPTAATQLKNTLSFFSSMANKKAEASRVRQEVDYIEVTVDFALQNFPKNPWFIRVYDSEGMLSVRRTSADKVIERPSRFLRDDVI